MDVIVSLPEFTYLLKQSNCFTVYVAVSSILFVLFCPVFEVQLFIVSYR